MFLAPALKFPPDEDNLRKALCKKLGCDDLGGAGTYGVSPVSFTACCNTGFLGAAGAKDRSSGASSIVAVEETLGLEGLLLGPAGCVPVNLDDKLDNHEFRRVGVDSGDFGLPFIIAGFSVAANFVVFVRMAIAFADSVSW